MIALVLAAFILYLYTPHLLFKFAAATQYDFITRKELPQVEEFFAAGLPSLFLNGLTFTVLYGGYNVLGYAPLVIDRAAVARVFQKEPDLSTYVATGNLSLLTCYLGALAVFSWTAGWTYGRTVKNVAAAGGAYTYLLDAVHMRAPWGVANELPFPVRGALVGWRLMWLGYQQAWKVFYVQYEQPLYPVVLRNSYAFVHTKGGLFHGILFQLDKKRDGEVAGIVLVAVSRFSRKKEEECLRLGQNPITELSGPLFIKWEEIVDINYPPSGDTLRQKREFYDQKLEELSSQAAARRTRANRFVRYRKLHARTTPKGRVDPSANA